MPWKMVLLATAPRALQNLQLPHKKEGKKKGGKLFKGHNSFVTAVSFKTTNTVTHSKTQHVPHSKYLLLACIPTEDKQ